MASAAAEGTKTSRPVLVKKAKKMAFGSILHTRQTTKDRYERQYAWRKCKQCYKVVQQAAQQTW